MLLALLTSQRGQALHLLTVDNVVVKIRLVTPLLYDTLYKRIVEERNSKSNFN